MVGGGSAVGTVAGSFHCQSSQSPGFDNGYKTLRHTRKPGLKQRNIKILRKNIAKENLQSLDGVLTIE